MAQLETKELFIDIVTEPNTEENGQSSFSPKMRKLEPFFGISPFAVDECSFIIAMATDCYGNGFCVNSFGSFVRYCQSGFAGNGAVQKRLSGLALS